MPTAITLALFVSLVLAAACDADPTSSTGPSCPTPKDEPKCYGIDLDPVPTCAWKRREP